MISQNFTKNCKILLCRSSIYQL